MTLETKEVTCLCLADVKLGSVFRAIIPNLILNILGKRMTQMCFYKIFSRLRHYKDHIKYTLKIFHECLDGFMTRSEGVRFLDFKTSWQ